MKKKKGQAIVETALVIPILLMFFCGIIDFGRIIHAQSRLNLICQESVRLAGLGKGDSEVTSYAKGKVPSAIVKINPLVNSSDGKRNSGDNVTVILSYDVKYITPLVNIIFKTPFKVQAESTIRVE